MPSRFPGMDPYIESHWRDVHARLIIYASDALQGVLPAALRARVEERVLRETPQCYRNGAYDGTLNYADEPEPPLLGADEQWAHARLHEFGLRASKKGPRRKNKQKS